MKPDKKAFKYYISAFWGGLGKLGGWVQNLGKPADVILERSLTCYSEYLLLDIKGKCQKDGGGR